MTLPPVFFVCGAFGAGKSTLAPVVADRLRECLVLDVDWLLPALSALTRTNIEEDRESWPALREVWFTLAGAVARSGRSTVFFAPSGPWEINALPSRQLVGEAHWLLLDCADQELRLRLNHRAGWREELTLEALADAAHFRTLGLDTIRTDLAATNEAAGSVVAWVRNHLQR